MISKVLNTLSRGHLLPPQPDNSHPPPQLNNYSADPQKTLTSAKGLMFVLDVKMMIKSLSCDTPVATLLSSETEKSQPSPQPSEYSLNERSSPLTKGFVNVKRELIAEIFMFVILTSTGTPESDIAPQQPSIPSTTSQMAERKLGSQCACLIVLLTMTLLSSSFPV